MSKKTKIWLLCAAACVVLGALIFTVTLAACGWDIMKLNQTKISRVTHEITQEVHSIEIDVKTADVVLIRSSDGASRAVCDQREKMPYQVTVEDGRLKIQVLDFRKWYDYISFFSFGVPKVTLYLTEELYQSITVSADTGDLQIPRDFSFGNAEASTSTGDIDWHASKCESLKLQASTGNITVNSAFCVRGLTAQTDTGDIRISSINSEGAIELCCTTGKIYLMDVTCRDVSVETNTGDVVFKNTQAETLTAQTDTGDVRFDFSDAQTIRVTTDTGDVQGTLNSPKVFMPRTATGRIDVPKTTDGGVCEITTDTGDISIKLA